MKRKGLAIVLLIAILASCLVLSSAAADGKPVVHSVTLTSCNYTLEGWGGMSAPSGVLQVEGSDGTYVVKKVAAKAYTVPGTCINFTYTQGTTRGEFVDISGCDYLVVHAYFSSNAVGSSSMQVELNSNTMVPDATGEVERAFTLDALAGGTLQAGWNDLKIPLTGVNQDMLAKFQWLRVFNSGAMTIEGDDLIMAIDKMYAEKADSSKVEVSDCTMKMKGWGGKTQAGIYIADPDDEDDYDRNFAMQSVSGSVGAAGLNQYFNRKNAYTKEEDQYIDATGMKFLVFNLYVSDADKVKDKTFALEITSAGAADSEELQYVATLGKLADYKLQNGWNEIILGLDREDAAGYNTVNWAHVNWFRCFINEGFEAGDDFTWGFDEIYFWDGVSSLDDGFEYETYSKNGINDDFVVKCTTGKHTEGNFYFADANGELILKFPIKNAATANKAFIVTKCGSQLLLQVSGDGENWTDVFKDESGDNDGIKVGSRYFNITKYINFESSDTIYVRYADSVPANGNGGRCYNIDLYVAYEVVEAPDPHYTTITTLDTTSGIGGGWAVNTDLVNQGKASVSRNFNGEVSAAGFMFVVNFANLRTKEFDTTNFVAVTLDMYVSDPSVIKDKKFELEFCSGGGCDNEESRFLEPLSKFVAEGTTFRKGWNTLVFPLDQLTASSNPGLNRTKLNYIRFYNLDAMNFATETTVAFDNLRLWDGDDGTVETEYSPVITFSDTLVKFVVTEFYEGKAVYFTGNAGDAIEYSFDAETYTSVAKADGKYDITDACDFFVPNFEYIYVKTASKADDLKLVVAHKELVTAADKDANDMMSTTHSIPLNIDSQKWNGGAVIRSNPTPFAGTTALKVSLNKTACENNTHQTPNITFDDIDATGMDTLEFEIYFSNDEIMDIMLNKINDGQFELCSGGSCDQEETSWTFNQLKSFIVDDIKSGEWLHVVLVLDTAAQKAINLEHVNYFRSYFRTEAVFTCDEEDAYFCYDNFRLTDAQAFAKIDAKPEADAATALVAELRTLLGVPSGNDIPAGAITAENVDAVKAAYAAAKAAADALSTAASSLFKENTFLRKTNTAINNYEKGENETQPPQDDETQQSQGDDETQSGSSGNTETSGNTPGEGETKKEEETGKKKGCGSIVGGSILLLIAIGAAGITVAKKKED